MKSRVTEVSSGYSADSPATEKSRKAKHGSRACPGMEPHTSLPIAPGREPRGLFAA